MSAGETARSINELSRRLPIDRPSFASCHRTGNAATRVGTPVHSAGTRRSGRRRPAPSHGLCALSRVEQGDRFDATSSITICAFTSDPTDAPLFRLVVEPTDANGLETISRLMVDKITTIPKAELGRRIARLADDDLLRLNRALMIFLGIAG